MQSTAGPSLQRWQCTTARSTFFEFLQNITRTVFCELPLAVLLCNFSESHDTRFHTVVLLLCTGYFGASGVNYWAVYATMWYHRHMAVAEDFGDRAMPYGRWYGGTMLMPDGRSYVTGGDEGPGSPRATGNCRQLFFVSRGKKLPQV